MKKLFCILACVCVLVTLCVMTASAETITGECGDNVTYTLDTETGLFTISGEGEMSSAYNAPWYSYRDSIKTVVIEKEVKTIGHYAFSDCTNLLNVTISDSVSYINPYAFSGCSSLTNITLSNNIPCIEYEVFQGCSSLTSITIPDGVSVIGPGAFKNCSSLESITIPNSVNQIDYEAFWGCSSLTSITIPNGVSRLDYSTFDGCTGLQNIVENLIYIKTTDNPYFCLQDTTSDSVTSFTINENTRLIAEEFFNYLSITSITIPDSVISLPVISNCQSLESITLGRGVTVYFSYTINSCPNLKDVYFPRSVTQIYHPFVSRCGEFTIHGLTGGPAYEYAITNSIPFICSHEFGEWNVITAASCIREGSKTRSCICGETETDIIPALGHSMEETIITNPTTSTVGQLQRICTTCGHTEYEEIPMLEIVQGDLDGDGEVSVKDALTSIKAVLNGTVLEGADMNGDGKLTLIDVLRVLKAATA